MKSYREILWIRVLSGLCGLCGSLAPAALALDGTNTLEMSMLGGWNAFELVTQGDVIGEFSDPGYGSTASRGTYDGLGAYLSDGSLSVYLNHETSSAAISRVDLNLEDFRQAIDSTIDGGVTPFPTSFVTGIGYAYDRIYDASYNAISNPDPVASGTVAVGSYGNSNFSRFCSGTSYLVHSFGAGRGFVDQIYMTGEEVSGGKFYAIDQRTRELWEVPDFGAFSWENAALADTGNTTHTAVVLMEDSGSAPIRLYIGEKGVDVNQDLQIDFLERNGLRGGTMYYFDPDGAASTVDLPDGTVTGTWNPVNSGAAGGVILHENKLEDVHTNPSDGTQLIFADQSDGVYTLDLDLRFMESGLDTTSSTATIEQIDDDDVAPVGAPDNLTWSLDGKLYVQEDGDGDDVWQMNSDGSGLTQISSANSEPSGIFDASEYLGYEPGSVFLSSVQGSGDSGAQLSAMISPTATRLPISADFVQNGLVDGFDFLNWQQGLGATEGVIFADGDANRDGAVGVYDLAIWEEQFGSGVPLLATAVPAPATMVLILWGGLAMVLPRRITKPTSCRPRAY